jgi:hypothetical protein
VKARCVHHRSIHVRATVLEDSRAVHSAAPRVIESLRVFFPGLVVRKADYASAEGRALAAKYRIERLPAYILDKEALKERGIDAVREALVPTADAVVLAPRLTGAHQYLARPRRAGRVDLFLAPHATPGAEALEEYLDLAARGEAPPTRLRAAVWRNDEGKLAARGGLAELEEMAREAAVSSRWPAKAAAYLRGRLARVGSSYWRDPVRAAGLDPRQVRRLAEQPATLGLLDADAQELAELGAGGAVVLLVSNQEVVRCASRADVRHALAAAGALAEAEGLRREAMPSLSDEAIPLLVRALEAVRPHARARIAAELKALSGADLGADPARWRAWLDRREGRD